MKDYTDDKNQGAEGAQSRKQRLQKRKTTISTGILC